MTNEELSQMIRVVKKKYILEMKQNKIAKLEGISSASVSRIINKAKDLGYVEVKLNFPSMEDQELKDKLKEMFDLKHVFVAKTQTDNYDLRLSSVSDELAVYLNEIIEDDSIVGVSWGETMTYLSNNLIPLKKNNLKIVQLNGGISNRNVSSPSENILINFAKNFSSEWYFLNAPSFVDNSEIANTIRKDSKVKEMLDLINNTDTVIFSVGAVSKDSILIQAGYFTEDEYEDLREKGYVGDICSRYFKIDGSHATGELYDRVIGISLEEIKNKKDSVCISIGKAKAKSILGGLRGKYINTLFTDDITAKEIIRLENKNTNA